MSNNPINRIRELRMLAGLSQRDLADRINQIGQQHGHHGAVSSDAVSRWERGRITPQPIYRRLLAEALNTTIEDLHLEQSPNRPTPPDAPEDFMDVALDPRVEHSQDEWRRTRHNLNTQRHQLAQLAASLYPAHHRIGATGLIAHPDWIPAAPVALDAVTLRHESHADNPVFDGTGPETSHARPRQTLVRRYPRYTHAIRDLAPPRLFENRLCWRLTDLAWDGGTGGTMTFGDTTYFAAVDVFEAVAHELAYVGLNEHGQPAGDRPAIRDLPFRHAIGDPFDLTRRPLMPAVSTLTIRNSPDGAEFLLHRRDPRSVAAAGGMLQVIPSGIFQPSSILPAAQRADFDLWRNFMREFSEELLGNPEHNGDGQPVDYDHEPFATLNTARGAGRIRMHCLGVALDALTLVGEVLTVAVVDADLFDELGRDFVSRNDEGMVVSERVPFTSEAIADLLASGRLAPAGAGCVELAWAHRSHILTSADQ